MSETMPDANSDGVEVIVKTITEVLENRAIDLESHVFVLDLLRPNLLKIRVKLQRELFEAREKLRMPNYKPDPKDKDTPRYTDFDRTTMLNAHTAELNEKYELVKGLEELVRERVELIKVLLHDRQA